MDVVCFVSKNKNIRWAFYLANVFTLKWKGAWKIYPKYTPCNQLALCNCQAKGKCPMKGKCQTMDAVYNCRVTSPESRKIYFGLVEWKWKKKYYNHRKLFTHKRYSHETTLSSYVWQLKEYLNVTPSIKCSVVRCATPYSIISKRYLLWYYEKLVIITCPRQYELLNKRSELFWV